MSKSSKEIKNKLLPVILSGGKGSRLWPLSRESYPKQYLNLEQESKYTLIQKTYLRLLGLENISSPIIICNEEHRFIVAEQMNEISIKPKAILLEPTGKGTAPAIAISALMSLEQNKDPLLLILSADHKISNEIEFRKTIKQAIPYAVQDKLVTFGVIPTSPETGYGYIESIEELNKRRNFSNIKKFIEKPNKELAKNLIKDKKYTWNSGIFLFKASTIINELNKFRPDIIDICKKSIQESKQDLDFHRINKDYFNKCSNVSIDVAVMEKTNLGTVVALDAGWNDIGDWNSVWKNSQKDSKGNTLIGNSMIMNSKDCYLRSEKRLIFGLDVNNLIVVETNDAILIAKNNSSQKVKDIVQDLEKRQIIEGKINKKVYKPWGNFISIEEGSTWKVKRLEIKPKGSLSLQMHQFRAEHWVVVSGCAKVEIDKKISLLKANESIYVPLKSKHRLSNPCDEPLILIEVQSGNYLGEDDILRFDDIYGRKL